MYYARRGSVPQQRHTQHRAPDGSLYAEELFGMEGFTGRSSLLYHRDAADADPQDRARQPDPPRGGGRRPPPPSIDEDRRRARERRRRDGSRAAVLQPRRRVRRRAPGGIDAGGDLLPQRHRRRDAVRPRRDGRMRHGLRAASLRTRRLPRPADRHDLAAGPGRGLGATDALPRGAVGDRAAEALPQRLRPAARARPVFAARPPRPGRGRGRATRTATS